MHSISPRIGVDDRIWYLEYKLGHITRKISINQDERGYEPVNGDNVKPKPMTLKNMRDTLKSRTLQFHDKKNNQKRGLMMQKRGEKNKNKDQQKIYKANKTLLVSQPSLNCLNIVRARRDIALTRQNIVRVRPSIQTLHLRLMRLHVRLNTATAVAHTSQATQLVREALV